MVLFRNFLLALRVVSPRQPNLMALVVVAAIGVFPLSVLANDAKLSDTELKEAKRLDWVPLAELTEAQKKEVPTACCGAYVAPSRTDLDANISPDEASLRATADESQTEQQAHHSMKGNVLITQGNRSVGADNADVDQETRQAELSGNIILREPGFIFRADKAKMDMDSGAARLDNVTFVLYESRVNGKARQLKRFGDNIIKLEDSRITSCEPGDNSWSMQGSEITINQSEHYGTARNMRINIKDVPVVYVPYIRFPVGKERLTGFLFPFVGQSSRNGFEIAAPFYWNIAPNYDATITPRYMSERGAVFEVDARHMSADFDTEVSGSVINNDGGGYSSFLQSEIREGRITEAEAYPYRGRDRWVYDVKQEGGRGQAWSTKLHYTDMSDNDFLRDMNNSAVDANRQAFVQQLASWDYHTEHWFVGAKVNEYRLLTPKQLPFRELPRIHFNGNYREGDVVFNLNNEYVNFAKNLYFNEATAAVNPITNQSIYDSTVYGERFNTDYNATWEKSSVWGFVKPSFIVKGLAFRLDDENVAAGKDRSPAFAVPQAAVDAGLYFERDTHIFGSDYLQTLEPRGFYFYSPYKNQNSLYNLTTNTSTTNNSGYINFDTSELTFNYNQLFRRSRFAGGDRIDDANQLSLGVSSALVSQSTGLERLRVSVGKIFYAQDREITSYDLLQVREAYEEELVINPDSDSARRLRNILKTNTDMNTRSSSPLALQLISQLGQGLRISADAAYDQHSDQLDSASAGIHYMDDQYRIFNLAYRYTLHPLITSPSQPPLLADQSLKQIDASILWPISSSWSAIARSNYDLNYGVELDTFAGFEYNDCCYRVRLMGRKWLKFDYNSPAFLENVTKNDYERNISIELQLKGLGSIGQGISKMLDKAVTGFSDREKTLR
ncbi:MAG: LPS-assembly protein LptD [Pseudomonadota bacterium]